MLHVVIADPFCPRAYDDRCLRLRAMGGTESSVTLMAESLVSEKTSVTVIQHCRTDVYRSSAGVTYLGCTSWRHAARHADADVAIVINSPKILALWHRQAPGTRLVLWRHNYLGNHYRRLGSILQQCKATMVCVSATHRLGTWRKLKSWPCPPPSEQVSYIYNPVQVYPPGHVQVKRRQLLFCSSPHKGLTRCLDLFDVVRQQVIPDATLIVCNPGYLPDVQLDRPGVQSIGPQSREQLHRLIAESLCVFYPQTFFAETFGLVAAEANALGTPILASGRLGALSEIVHPGQTLLSSVTASSVSKCAREWFENNRPQVSANSAFSVATVARQWRQLLQPRSEMRPALYGAADNAHNVATAAARSSDTVSSE